jgi:hypothetical protein
VSDDDVITQRNDVRVLKLEQPHCLRCLAETEGITIGGENGATTIRLYRYIYARRLCSALSLSANAMLRLQTARIHNIRSFFLCTLIRCQETACVVCNSYGCRRHKGKHRRQVDVNGHIPKTQLMPSPSKPARKSSTPRRTRSASLLAIVLMTWILSRLSCDFKPSAIVKVYSRF